MKRGFARSLSIVIILSTALMVLSGVMSVALAASGLDPSLAAASPDLSSTVPKPGQPCGSIYYSDIVAYVDDIPIRSYNIGGKTVLVCEDLSQYGFLVSWNPQSRILEVTTQPVQEALAKSISLRSSPELAPSGTPGSRAGTIFSTDIVTFFNGHMVKSYNIGGRTVVAIEDLANLNWGGRPLEERLYSDCGFSYVWDPEKRAIRLYSLRPGDEIICDLGMCTVSSLISPGQLGWLLQHCLLRLDGEPLKAETIVTLPVGNTFVPLADTLAVLGIKWHWNEEESILSLQSASLSPAGVVSDEAVSVQEESFRNICGINMSIQVGGQPFETPKDALKYVPSDAILVGGTVYIRGEALAAAVGLIFVPNDGFYRKTDSPIVWDHTFFPFTGNSNDWLASAVPSYFSAGRGFVGTYPHDMAEPIELTFSREMKEDTLSAENIPVFCAETLPDGRKEYRVISDSYCYSYDRASKRLTLTPVKLLNLSPGIEVMVAIKPQVADIDGNHPDNGFKIGFTVAK